MTQTNLNKKQHNTHKNKTQLIPRTSRRLSRAVPQPKARGKEKRERSTQDTKEKENKHEQETTKHTEAHRVRRTRAWPLQSKAKQQTGHVGLSKSDVDYNYL